MLIAGVFGVLHSEFGSTMGGRFRRAGTISAAAQRVSTGVPSPYKKRHALLTFGFCGTGYFGLQSQTADGDPERPTVSDVIRRALRDTGAIAE